MNNGSKLTIAEKFEFVGSISWLLMDFCWFKEWRLMAFTLIPPTVLAHLLVIMLGEKRFAYITVYSALNSWVIANALWIIGDLNKVELFTVAADVFFKLAITITGLVVLISFKDKSPTLILRLFRRFRIRH